MSPQVQLSVFTKFTGPLTKQLSLINGKVVSDSSECRMSNGLAERVTLPFSELPRLLKALTPTQAVTTGWVDCEPPTAEIITRDKFAERKYQFPAHISPQGVFATRTLNSMAQRGPSLIMFDHDFDEKSPHQFKDPQAFILALSKVIPDFDKITYIRTYSTSSSIYHKKTGECLRPADGYHIYMVIPDGSDLQRFGEVLEKRLWLAGLGYIKVSSKNGSMLKRTVVDTAVFSPERLIFEAGATILPGFDIEQRLPVPEFYQRDMAYLDTSRLENLSEAEEEAYQQAVMAAQNDEGVVTARNHVKDSLVEQYIQSAQNQGHFITRKMAARMVENLERHVLPPFHPIMFSDGSQVSILELVSNPFKYDGRTCFDPLRPDKGPDRAKFYGNTDQGIPNPVINSFVEGGRTFNLRDSLRLLTQYTHEEQADDLKQVADRYILQGSRYVEDFELRAGCTVIRAQKGTGKTTAAANVVNALVKEIDASVLAVTHRVSLTKALSKSFGLACYNERDIAAPHVLRSQKRLGICYDSVHKVAGQTYQVVVIDEITQLMRHIKSKSVKNKFICLNVLRSILKNAQYIIIMDADVSVQYLNLLKDELIGWLNKTTPFNIVVNTYLPAKVQGRTAKVYVTAADKPKPDEAGWQQSLLDCALREGVFVATNSKNHAYEVANHLAKNLGYSGVPITNGDFITEVSGRRIITITSDSTGEDSVHEFIANLNEQLRDDDILIASPSMGTGVSIDALNGKPRFAKTFGRFSRRAGNTSGDCSQHMARVRECTDFHLLILDTCELEDVDPNTIIEKEIIHRVELIDRQINRADRFTLNFDPVSNRYVFADGCWGEWFGRLTAIENQDRNHFTDNLLTMLKEEGYTLEEIIKGLPKSRIEELQAEMKEIKSVRKEYETQLLCDAPLITDEELKTLESETSLTMPEKRQLHKRQTADNFGVYDSDKLEELLRLTDIALAARRTALYFGMPGETIFILDLINRIDPEKQHIEKTFHFVKWNFMWQVADLIGVSIDENGLPRSSDLMITGEIRDAIYDCLWENRKDVKLMFNRGIKSLHKAHQEKDRRKLVGEFLATLGFKLQRKKRGCGNYYYEITTESLEQIRSDILTARLHSPLPTFKTITSIPKFLVSYVAQWNAGTPEKVPQIHRYVSALRPYQAEIFSNFIKRMVGMLQNNENSSDD